MEKKQQIALRLKEYRKASGKTQEEFGQSLGLTQGGYSDLERGKNNLTARIKHMLEEVYNINIDYLETGQGDERYRLRENNEEAPGDENNDKLSRDQNQRLIFQLQKELELTKKENEYLHRIISTKDDVIEALKGQRSKGENTN
jgi:transcriptional regulator with XRE-family HTH domain